MSRPRPIRETSFALVIPSGGTRRREAVTGNIPAGLDLSPAAMLREETMTKSTDTLNTELHRLRMHLNLLEKDATHPLDFTVEHSHTAPALVLREGQALRSAHSELRLDYEMLRQVLIEALRTEIAAREEKLLGSNGGNRPIEHLQFGDQTEA